MVARMSDNTAVKLEASDLAKMEFRGPVAFYDGYNGWARQDFQAVNEPRFTYAWQREDRGGGGRQYYMVDGREVASLEEAAKLLALPADPDSPAERQRREISDFKASPRLVGTATRALSEAMCNADVTPFSSLRPWNQRAENAWHNGINNFSDTERRAGRDWPRWLYLVKSAAYEISRLQYLWAADREKDTGLQCALGKRCRDCSILQHIEEAMENRRTKPMGILPPREIYDTDIDAAKTWTCIGHILSERKDVIDIDYSFLTTEKDRKHTWF